METFALKTRDRKVCPSLSMVWSKAHAIYAVYKKPVNSGPARRKRSYRLTRFGLSKSHLTKAMQDPVAITITWAIFELARHPKIAQGLREEVVRVYATPYEGFYHRPCILTLDRCGTSSPPSAKAPKDLVFLKYVIRETLRLYHPPM
jgi:hypothetical protein